MIQKTVAPSRVKPLPWRLSNTGQVHPASMAASLPGLGLLMPPTLRPASSGPHRAVLHDTIVVHVERTAVVDGADGEPVVPPVDDRVVGTQVAQAPG